MANLTQQDRIVSAVIRHLADRAGVAIRSLFKPDAQNRLSKDIDSLVKLGECSYAIEHTRVESTAGELEDHVRLVRVLCPLRDELRAQLPTGLHFTLYVNAFAIRKGTDWNDLKKRVGEWAVRTAPILQHPGPGGLFAVSRESRQRTEILGVDVELWRDIGEQSGLTIGRALGEPKQVETVMKALAAKCEKLARYREKGCRTVLVLEKADHVTNLHSVAWAFKAAASKARVPLPDDVYAIDAPTRADHWWILTCKSGQRIGALDLASVRPCGSLFEA